VKINKTAVAIVSIYIASIFGARQFGRDHVLNDIKRNEPIGYSDVVVCFVPVFNTFFSIGYLAGVADRNSRGFVLWFYGIKEGDEK
jgi:hypothetical protein